jgi:hypothetical protein
MSPVRMRYSEKGLSPELRPREQCRNTGDRKRYCINGVDRFVEEWDVREDSVLFVYSICTCCTLVFEHNFSFFQNKLIIQTIFFDRIACITFIGFGFHCVFAGYMSYPQYAHGIHKC